MKSLLEFNIQDKPKKRRKLLLYDKIIQKFLVIVLINLAPEKNLASERTD
jgi:hypothetical protein